MKKTDINKIKTTIFKLALLVIFCSISSHSYGQFVRFTNATTSQAEGNGNTFTKVTGLTSLHVYGTGRALSTVVPILVEPVVEDAANSLYPVNAEGLVNKDISGATIISITYPAGDYWQHNARDISLDGFAGVLNVFGDTKFERAESIKLTVLNTYDDWFNSLHQLTSTPTPQNITIPEDGYTYLAFEVVDNRVENGMPKYPNRRQRIKIFPSDFDSNQNVITKTLQLAEGVNGVYNVTVKHTSSNPRIFSISVKNGPNNEYGGFTNFHVNYYNRRVLDSGKRRFGGLYGVTDGSADSSIHTFTNDDTQTDYTVKIERKSATVQEMDATPMAVFNVYLYNEAENRKATIADAPSSTDITIDYGIAGDAIAGEDYTDPPTKQVIINANTVERELSIPVIKDDTADSNKNILVYLKESSLSTAAISSIANDAAQSILIINDEILTLKLEREKAEVGEERLNNTARFNIRLYKGSTPAIENDPDLPSTAFEVTYQISGQATSGDDYTAIENKVVTIAANTNTGELAIEIRNDLIFEEDETLTVQLLKSDLDFVVVSTVEAENTQTMTIKSHNTIDVSIESITSPEGQLGSHSPSLKVRGQNLEGVTVPFTVQVTTTDGTAISTGLYADYTSGAYTGTPFTVSIPARNYLVGDNQTVALPSIKINADRRVEPNETFTIAISSTMPPESINIVTPTITYTITDDDAVPLNGFSVDFVSAETSQEEGNGNAAISGASEIRVTGSNLAEAVKIYAKVESKDANSTNAITNFGVFPIIIPARDYTTTSTIPYPSSILVRGDTSYDPDKKIETTLLLPADYFLYSMETEIANNEKAHTIETYFRDFSSIEFIALDPRKRNGRLIYPDRQARVKINKSDFDTQGVYSKTFNQGDVSELEVTVKYDPTKPVLDFSILVKDACAINGGFSNVVIKGKTGDPGYTSTQPTTVHTITNDDNTPARQFIAKLEYVDGASTVTENTPDAVAKFKVKIYKTVTDNGITTTIPAVATDNISYYDISIVLSGTALKDVHYTHSYKTSGTVSAIRIRDVSSGTTEYTFSLPILYDNTFGDKTIIVSLSGIFQTGTHGFINVIDSSVPSEKSKTITIKDADRLEVVAIPPTTTADNSKIMLRVSGIDTSMATQAISLQITIPEGAAKGTGDYAGDNPDYNFIDYTPSAPYTLILPPKDYRDDANQIITLPFINILTDKKQETPKTIILSLASSPAYLLSTTTNTVTYTIPANDVTFTGVTINFNENATSQNEGNTRASVTGISPLVVSGVNFAAPRTVYILAEPGGTNPVDVENLTFRDIISSVVIPVTIPANDYTVSTNQEVAIAAMASNLLIAGDGRNERDETIKLTLLKPSENFFYSMGSVTATTAAHTINTTLTDFETVSFEVLDNRVTSGTPTYPDRHYRYFLKKSDFTNGTYSNIRQLVSGGLYTTTITSSNTSGRYVFSIYVNHVSIHGGFTNFVAKGSTQEVDFTTTKESSVHTLTNDDAEPSLHLELETVSASVNEGATDSKAQFRLAVYKQDGTAATAAEVTTAVTATYILSGTATKGTDYTSTATTITVPSGVASQNIDIPIQKDGIIEEDETIVMTLLGTNTNVVGMSTDATKTKQTITIKSDNTLKVSMENQNGVEGDAGTTTPLVLKVTGLDYSDVPEILQVTLVVTDGTGASGAVSTGDNPDYSLVGATVANTVVVNIPTLDYTVIENQTITIPRIRIHGDRIQEENETFSLQLSTTQTDFITVQTAPATYTINNDDSSLDGFTVNFSNAAYNQEEGDDKAVASSTPNLVVTGGTLAEANRVYVLAEPGDTNPVNANSFVARDILASTVIVVNLPASDYSQSSNQNISIVSAAGTLEILGDTDFESDETIKLSILNPSNHHFVSMGEQTITEAAVVVPTPFTDFTTVSFEIVDKRVIGGMSDANRQRITINKNAFDELSNTQKTLNIPLSDGGNSKVVVTHTPISTNPIIFSVYITQGENVKGAFTNLVVKGTGADIPSFTSASQATSVLTLTNDDTAPTYTVKLEKVSMEAIDEGVESPQAQFKAVLYSGTTRASSSSVTTEFTLYYEISGTVTAGEDYERSTSIIVPASALEQNIDIPIRNEGKIESDETLRLTLVKTNSTAVGVSLTDVTQEVVIKSVNKLSVAITGLSGEEDSSATPIALQVKGLNLTGRVTPVTVSIIATDNTATSSGGNPDYSITGGQAGTPFVVTIPPRDYTQAANQNVPVGNIRVNTDSEVEPDETINIAINTPLPAALINILTPSVSYTITNDDIALEGGLTINFKESTSSQTEGNDNAPVVATGLSAITVSGGMLSNDNTVYILAEPGDTNPVNVESLSGRDIRSSTIIPVRIPAGDYTSPIDVTVVASADNLQVIGDTSYENDETIKLTLLNPSEYLFYSMGRVTTTPSAGNTINTPLTDFETISFEILDKGVPDNALADRRYRYVLKKSDFTNGTYSENRLLVSEGSYATTVTSRLVNGTYTFSIYVNHHRRGSYTNLIIQGTTGHSPFTSTIPTSIHTLTNEDIAPAYTVKLEKVTTNNVDINSENPQAQFKLVLYQGDVKATTGPATAVGVTIGLSGTAVAGQHYRAPGVVTIPANQVEQALNIDILSTGSYASSNTLTVSLASTNQNTVGISPLKTETTQTVNLVNTRKLTVALDEKEIQEGDFDTITPINLKVSGINLSGYSTPVSVQLTVVATGTTAVIGANGDFNIKNGTIGEPFSVSIPARDYTQVANQTINIPNIEIYGDRIAEENKAIKIIITTPMPPALLVVSKPSPATYDYALMDDDISWSGVTVNFAETQTRQAEGNSIAPARGLSGLSVSGNVAKPTKLYILAEPGGANPIGVDNLMTRDIRSSTVITVPLIAGSVAQSLDVDAAASNLEIMGDTRYEVDETIKLSLLNPARNTFFSMGEVTTGTPATNISTAISYFSTISFEVVDIRRENELVKNRRKRVSFSRQELLAATDNRVSKTVQLDDTAEGSYQAWVKLSAEVPHTFTVGVNYSMNQGGFTNLVIAGDTGIAGYASTTSMSTHTLTNDEAAPAITLKLERISTERIKEGEKAIFNIVLYKADNTPVQLDSPEQPTVDITVPYQIGGDVTEADYTPPTSKEVTISNGKVSQTLEIMTLANDIVGVDERLTVVLLEPQIAGLGLGVNKEDYTQTVLINGVNKITVSIEDASANEGQLGTSTPVRVKVTGADLSAYPTPITVSLTATDGTATSTGDNPDYTINGSTSGAPFIFNIPLLDYKVAANQWVTVPNIIINGDKDGEDDETIQLRLNTPTRPDVIKLGDTNATFTINNDDNILSGLTISFKEAQTSQREGDTYAPAKNLSPLVIKGGILPKPATVYIRAEPGDTNPIDGSRTALGRTEQSSPVNPDTYRGSSYYSPEKDIVGATVIPVVIPAGDYTTQQEIAVIATERNLEIVGDRRYEGDENIKLTLLNPSDHYFLSMGSLSDRYENFQTPLPRFDRVTFEVFRGDSYDTDVLRGRNSIILDSKWIYENTLLNYHSGGVFHTGLSKERFWFQLEFNQFVYPAFVKIIYTYGYVVSRFSNIVFDGDTGLKGFKTERLTSIHTLTNDDAISTLQVKLEKVTTGDISESATNAKAVFKMVLYKGNSKAVMNDPDLPATPTTFAISTSGTASANLDYIAPPTTVTIAPYQVEKQIEIVIQNDDLFEQDEVLTVKLTGVNTNKDTIRISDVPSEQEQSVTITSAGKSPYIIKLVKVSTGEDVSEGDGLHIVSFNDFLGLDLYAHPSNINKVNYKAIVYNRATNAKASAEALTAPFNVSYRVTGGNAPRDVGNYFAVSETRTNSISFAAGEIEKPVKLFIVDNNFISADRSLTIELLSSSSNLAVLSDVEAETKATVLVREDDKLTVSLAPESIIEGNGRKEVPIYANVVGADLTYYDDPITVPITITDGTAMSTTGTPDYGIVGSTSGNAFRVILPKKNYLSVQKIQIATLIIHGNAVPNADKTITVSLGTPTPARLATVEDATKTATYTINDDDGDLVVKLIPIATSNIDESATNAKVSFKVKVYNSNGAEAIPAAITSPITVGYVTSGTATAGADYTASSQVVIAANTIEQALDIQIQDDNIVEAQERIIVQLMSVTGNNAAGLSDILGEVKQSATIRSEDKVTVALLAQSVLEGKTGTSTPFSLQVTGASLIGYSTAVTVQLTVSDLTATSEGENADYAIVGGTVDTPFTFTIPSADYTTVANQKVSLTAIAVNGDSTKEEDETLSVTLSSPSADVTIDSNRDNAVFTIKDDDTNFLIKLEKVTTADINENTSGAKATFKAVLYRGDVKATSGVSTELSINYEVSGTAEEGSDYETILTKTVVIPSGDLEKAFDITIIDDNLVENTETLTVSLTAIPTSGIVNLSKVPAEISQSVSIVSEDRITITIEDQSAPEGNDDNQKPIEVKVVGASLIGFPTSITAQLTITDGTSPNGAASPYYTIVGNHTSGVPFSVTIPPKDYTDVRNQVLEVARVNVKGNTTNESSKTFSLRIATPTPTTAATLGTKTTATYTINNDDSALYVKIEPLTSTTNSIDESSTTPQAQFTIKVYKKDVNTAAVAADVTETFTVNYTIEGTATVGEDYTDTTTKAIIFAVNDIQKDITISILNDNLAEDAETLTLKLASVVSASDGVGLSSTSTEVEETITINSEDMLTISVLSQTVDEGDTGTTTPITIEVKGASLTSATPLEVKLTTARPQTTNAATFGEDYTFAETTLGSRILTATIPLGDYTQVANQNVVVSSLFINGDTSREVDETFQLSIQSISSTIATQGSSTPAIITIRDDEAAAVYTIKLDRVSPENTDESNTNGAQFMVALYKISDGSKATTSDANLPSVETTVGFQIGGTALSPADYITPAATSVTIPAGSVEIPLTLALSDDNIMEANKTIEITLISTTSAGTIDLSATEDIVKTITIVSDDKLTASLEDQFTFEGGAGTKTENVRIKVAGAVLPSDYGQPLTISLTVTDGSGDTGAVSSGDSPQYTITEGTSGTAKTISIPPKDYTLTANQFVNAVEVTINGNDTPEPSKSFSLAIAEPSPENAIVLGAKTTASYTINNDDNQLFVKLEAVTTGPIAEDTADAKAQFTIKAYKNDGSAAVEADITTGFTVNYTITGTTTAGEDYTDPDPKTVVFAVGEIEKALDIAILNDTFVESDETIIVKLSSVTGTTELGLSATAAETEQELTITSEDTLKPFYVKLERIAESVNENTPDAKAQFSIKIYKKADNTATEGSDITAALTVTYELEGTAVAGADYTEPNPKTVVFAIGEVEKALDIAITNDELVEENETIIVKLVGITGFQDVGFSDDNTFKEQSVTIINLDVAPPPLGLPEGSFLSRNIDANTPSQILSLTASNRGLQIAGLADTNKVVIYNRLGVVVWQTENYPTGYGNDGNDNYFRGESNTYNSTLPTGTYFMVIENYLSTGTKVTSHIIVIVE